MDHEPNPRNLYNFTTRYATENNNAYLHMKILQGKNANDSLLENVKTSQKLRSASIQRKFDQSSEGKCYPAKKYDGAKHRARTST
jgi:hypothetical protein